MGKITKEGVKSKFYAIHEFKYDYIGCRGDSSKNYVIDATCPVHGFYSGTYTNLITKKNGCPACGKRKNFTEESFKLECNYVHGGKFGYGKTKYKLSHELVTVTCPHHGDFDVKAYVHLAGHDCYKCAKESHVGYYDLLKMTNKQKRVGCVLYHVRFTNFDGSCFDKIGVSVNGWFRRFNKYRKHFKSIEIVRECSDTLENCLLMESVIIESLKSENRAYKVHDLKRLGLGGWTECFYQLNT